MNIVAINSTELSLKTPISASNNNTDFGAILQEIVKNYNTNLTLPELPMDLIQTIEPIKTEDVEQIKNEAYEAVLSMIGNLNINFINIPKEEELINDSSQENKDSMLVKTPQNVQPIIYNTMETNNKQTVDNEIDLKINKEIKQSMVLMDTIKTLSNNMNKNEKSVNKNEEMSPVNTPNILLNLQSKISGIRNIVEKITMLTGEHLIEEDTVIKQKEQISLNNLIKPSNVKHNLNVQTNTLNETTLSKKDIVLINKNSEQSFSTETSKTIIPEKINNLTEDKTTNQIENIKINNFKIPEPIEGIKMNNIFSDKKTDVFNEKIDPFEVLHIKQSKDIKKIAKTDELVMEPFVMEKGIKMDNVSEKEKVILKQVVEQLPSPIKEGITEIKIDLKPESLGKITLTMTVKDNEININFKIEQTETQKSMEQSIPQLKNELQKQGWKMENITFDFNNNFLNQQKEQQQQPKQRRNVIKEIEEKFIFKLNDIDFKI